MSRSRGTGSGNAPPRAGQRAAFTLVELVFVMLIIGALAMMAAPRFSRSMARERAGGAARRIIADLALARQEARLKGKSRTVEFNLSQNSYKLNAVQDINGSAVDYIVNLAEEPYEAVITTADFGDDAIVTFDPYGHPDSGGTITVRAGRYGHAITLDAVTGKASIDTGSGTIVHVGGIAVPDSDPGMEVESPGTAEGELGGL